MWLVCWAERSAPSRRRVYRLAAATDESGAGKRARGEQADVSNLQRKGRPRLTAGQRHDMDQAESVAERLAPDCVVADNEYDSDLLRLTIRRQAAIGWSGSSTA